MNKSLESTTSLATESALAPGEIVLGMLSAIDSTGNPLVAYPQCGLLQRVAVSTVPVLPRHIGRQVALLFVNGDVQKPLILGFIHDDFQDLLNQAVSSAAKDIAVFDVPAAQAATPVAATVSATALLAEGMMLDDKKVLIEAEEQLVLRCGESSITLTKSGKIMIRGKYLVSRSSGVNRILGGAVNIN